MQTSPKLLAALMAAPLAFTLAIPAQAGPYNGHRDGWSETRHASSVRGQRDYYSNAKIERRLERLSREIRHARRSGLLSRFEARTFRRKLNSVERGYHAFARNGLSRRDIRVTMRRLRNVSDQLSNARYRYDRHNRYDDRRYTRRGYYRR